MKSTRCIRRSAFTLIELLTVIAIIAVLAAIIFPVFGAVRENARRASCMSNMHQIAVGVKQYELDNRKYPDFLFSPALKSDGAGGCAIFTDPANPSNPNNGKLIAATAAADVACTVDQASATGKLGDVYVDATGTTIGVGSLYPEYVKSVNTFLCPDNSWFYATGNVGYNTAPTNLTDYPVTAPLSRYNTTTTTSTSLTDKNIARYYKFDSYDANPAINKVTGTGAALPAIQASQGNWQLRYARQWMNGVVDPTNLTGIPVADQPFYNKQMIWKNPSDDAVLTMCDFHVPSGKVVVVFLSGTAKVYDLKVLTEKGLPVTTTSPTDFDAYRLTP